MSNSADNSEEALTTAALAELRKAASSSTICMGMGGEEVFVDFTRMILPRNTVLALINQIEELQHKNRIYCPERRRGPKGMARCSRGRR